MKIPRLTVCIALCALVMLSDTGRTLRAASPPARLALPPVSAALLDNGIRFFHVRDELPMVTVTLSSGYGRLYEDRESAGLSDLLAMTMSLGGSAAYPGGALHERVDAMGGSLSVSASWESVTISIKVLDRFREEAFAIVADLAAKPNLDPGYIENAKGLVVDAIRRKYDDPADLAFEKARERIFGGTGYGAVPTEESVRSLSPARVREAWKTHFAGRNIMIGAVSPMERRDAESLCRRNFSLIEAGEPVRYGVDIRAVRERVSAARGKVFFIKKDIPQSTVVVGTVAPDIRNGGAYALELMNYILGGGSFSSRLMEEIRVRRGMAYAVQSIYRPRRDTGVFLAYAQTESGYTGDVLGLLVDNIVRVAREPIRHGELEWSRGAIANSFVFRFDSPMKILSNRMEIAYNGLPDDYDETYLERINGVDAGAILSESGELFNPGLVKLVVGHPSVATDLERFGEVVYIE